MVLFILALFSVVFWIISVVIVNQDAKKTGRNTAVWTIITILFPILGLILYFYDKSRHPSQSDTDSLPSLEVSCRVEDNQGEQKVVGMIIKSNSVDRAKEIFRDSCSENSLILIESPNVSVHNPDATTEYNSNENNQRHKSIAKIRKLKKLNDQDVITDNEFKEKKNELLDKI